MLATRLVLGLIPLTRSLQDGIVVLGNQESNFALTTILSSLTRYTQRRSSIQHWNETEKRCYPIDSAIKLAADSASNSFIV